MKPSWITMQMNFRQSMGSQSTKRISFNLSTSNSCNNRPNNNIKCTPHNSSSSNCISNNIINNTSNKRLMIIHLKMKFNLYKDSYRIGSSNSSRINRTNSISSKIMANNNSSYKSRRYKNYLHSTSRRLSTFLWILMRSLRYVLLCKHWDGDLPRVKVRH